MSPTSHASRFNASTSLSQVLTNAPILYAEDDGADIYFLQHAFGVAGITNPMQVAPDGQDAIDYLSGKGAFADRSRYPLPCLVILDLKMPRTSGLEVLAWLRQVWRLPPLPVIILSSSAQPRDIDRAFELGANAFVTKPASVAERVRLARCIKDFWLHFNQPAGFQAAA